ncbi:hypothetical protein Scep_002135 [Stephania cephalantha]|uniref:Uncharacterized protein n=1 Tax=Stephania cephalantha TaxID=152367 RepID=A0AAP0Q5P6_9MAGN
MDMANLSFFCCSSSSNYFHVILSATLLVLSTTMKIVGGIVQLPDGVVVPAVLAFGDSIVDTGNNNNLPTIAKANYPPYGQNFMGGFPTGRFCNGKIPSDMIVNELGIKEVLPAYLDPKLQPTELLTGVSFASGGSGYDPLTAKLWIGTLDLSSQLNLFKEYIERVKAMVGEERTQSIISDSLYVLVAGSNDIANTYFDTPARKFVYDVPAYTDLMLHHAKSFIQELYEIGARRIAVTSAPPLGCLPAQRTLAGGKQRECAEEFNKASDLFNSKLSNALDQFNKECKHLRAVYIDIFNPLLDLIKNPRSYGFEVSDRGCCGTGLIEAIFLCNMLNLFTCKDVTKYVFWDSYHPTEKAYRTLFIPILKSKATSFYCGDRPC